MRSDQETLDDMSHLLHSCQQGELPLHKLIARWRELAPALPLPPRFGQVLGDWLDRLEAGALFNEESCSFSQKDMLASLQSWLEQARQKLG